MTARIFVLLAFLSLAEAAILSPFIWLLVPPPRAIQPTVLVGFVWLVLMGLAVQWRWLAQRGVQLRLLRVLMGAWLIVLFVAAEIATFGTAPSALPDALMMMPGFLAALVLWWRGMALGNSDLQPRTVDLHFQVGTLVLIGTSLITIFTRSMEVVPVITAFFFASLATLPLSNLEYTHQHHYGRRAPMTRGWWGWVLGSVVAVMLIALVVMSLLTGKNAAEVLASFITLLMLPVFILLSLLPIAFFDWFITILRRILAGFGSLSNLFPQPQQPLPASTTNSPTLPVLPAEANFLIAIVIFVALAVIIILLVQQARKDAPALERDGTDIDGKLRDAQADAGALGQVRMGLDGLRRWLAVMTIRRLYARATHEAAKRGQRRTPAQTPYDFLPHMQNAFPTAEADARAITDAYVAAHYGEVADSQAALDALKQSWERMRAVSAPPLSPPTANETLKKTERTPDKQVS